MRKPLTALDTVVASIDAGEIGDPGDLIAKFAATITEELDPEVADLGDELDDCEADLDADHVFELRRTVTHVRVEAIRYRRFLSPRSEEHTSELQSLMRISYAVFCLKKQMYTHQQRQPTAIT